jgi:hypothetical protein
VSEQGGEIVIGKLVGLAAVLVVGFVLTVKGNPSYWQIIGLILMIIPVIAAAVMNLQEDKETGA